MKPVIEIHTYRADRTLQTDRIPSLELYTDLAAPTMNVSSAEGFADVKLRYEEHAKTIVRGMLRSMPQALTDQILAELLKAKSGVLQIPTIEPEQDQ